MTEPCGASCSVVWLWVRVQVWVWVRVWALVWVWVSDSAGLGPPRSVAPGLLGCFENSQETVAATSLRPYGSELLNLWEVGVMHCG